MALVHFLMVAFIMYAVLFYLGIRYPRARKDWPHDAPTTARYIVLGLFFIFVLVVLYLISSVIQWPSGTTVLLIVATVIFGILILAGLYFPRGVRLRKDDRETDS